MAKRTKLSNGPTARERLRSLTDQVVRLEEEKKQIGAEIKAIYAAAESEGFSKKALRGVVKDSMKTPEQREAEREVEAIRDVYRANLGLLDGLPLGEAARKRMDEERKAPEPARKPPGEDQQDDEHHDDHYDDDAPEAEAARQKPDTVEDAHERGVADHKAGKRITQNPYPAGSPQRAAWDEAWCEADGSDGMDLPAAWKPKDDKKADGKKAEKKSAKKDKSGKD